MASLAPGFKSIEVAGSTEVLCIFCVDAYLCLHCLLFIVHLEDDKRFLLFAVEPSFHLARPLAGFGNGLYFGENVVPEKLVLRSSILTPTNCPEVVLMGVKIYTGRSLRTSCPAFLELERALYPPHTLSAFVFTW